MSITAMRHALEALENNPYSLAYAKAITTLRTAIQAAEKVEPVMIYHGGCTIDCGGHGHHNVEMLKMIPAGSKLYTTPPAAQQGMTIDASAPIVMTPHPAFAKRQWVGLTEEEIELLSIKHAPPIHPDFTEDDDFIEFAHAIEAQLREKNTGELK